MQEKFDLKTIPIPKISNLEGRSFNPQLENQEKRVEADEVEISIQQPEIEKTQILEEVARLKKLRDEKPDTISSRPETKFFFDQSNEVFMREIEKETFLKASVKDEMKILGTLFNTYIVIEYANSVYFIDQHAGHERLLYDKIVNSINENNVAKQALLAPYTFIVGAKESQYIDQILDDLARIGFDISKEGYNYSINSVPYLLSFINLADFVDEILSGITIFDKKATDFIHDKLSQTACKHAIKAGDSITKDECAYLIEEVKKGVMLCPHGRPITLIITKHEFEKMFKRIV